MAEIITAIFLVFVGSAGVDVPALISRRRWKDLRVYMVFWLTGLIINVLARIFEVDFAFISDWLVRTIGYT